MAIQVLVSMWVILVLSMLPACVLIVVGCNPARQRSVDGCKSGESRALGSPAVLAATDDGSQYIGLVL